jgi:hypothetical protein
MSCVNAYLAVELSALCEVVIILSVVASHISSDFVTVPCLRCVCLRPTEGVREVVWCTSLLFVVQNNKTLAATAIAMSTK